MDEVEDVEVGSSAAAWTRVGVKVQMGSCVDWGGGTLHDLTLVVVRTTGDTLYWVLVTVPIAMWS